MNEIEAERLLHRVRDDIAIGPAPRGALLRAGRRARRRRQVAQALGAAAAVALVVSAGLALRPEVAAAPDADEAVAPVAPPGTRLVGMGQVAVAVPESWGTNQVGCDGDTAMQASVVFDSEGSRLCLVRPQLGISSLHIFPAWSDHAQGWLDADGTMESIDGVTVRRVGGGCDEPRPPSCSGGLVVPGQDVVMYVQTPDLSVVDEVLDSATLLPDDWTTVPYDPNGPSETTIARMEAAGLAVEVVEEFRPDLSAGVLLDTDPALGSAVEVGSTVTVRISAGPELEPGEQTTPITAAEQTPDGGLFVTVPTCYGQGVPWVEELPETVTVTAWAGTDDTLNCSDPLPVEIKEPLGDRPLIDGATGEVVFVHPEPQPHDFTLLTHCGIEFAQFAGGQWATEPLLGDDGNPPPGWDNPFQQGQMTLVDRDTAVFTTDGHPPLTFHPTDRQPPGCS